MSLHVPLGHVPFLQYVSTTRQPQAPGSAVASTTRFPLSPWKSSFTLPRWTAVFLQGVTILLSLFLHLSQNPVCHPRCQEQGGKQAVCPMQWLGFLSGTLINRTMKREETLEVMGFSFLIS